MATPPPTQGRVTDPRHQSHIQLDGRDRIAARAMLHAIGFSNDDGSVSSRKATAQELADANRTANGGADNELKLELRDGQGNKKDLKLRFKQ